MDILFYFRGNCIAVSSFTNLSKTGFTSRTRQRPDLNSKMVHIDIPHEKPVLDRRVNMIRIDLALASRVLGYSLVRMERTSQDVGFENTRVSVTSKSFTQLYHGRP